MWTLLFILALVLLWTSPALRQAVAQRIAPDERRPLGQDTASPDARSRTP